MEKTRLNINQDLMNAVGMMDVVNGNEILSGVPQCKVLVTGQDADLEACQRIVEGTQIMTVYKPVEKLARRAAECAVALAEDKDISGDVGVIDNGVKDVPFVKLEPVKVDKENMDEVIVASGFHSKEDVYLNVK